MPAKQRPPMASMDAFYEQLREAQRIEQQRIKHERDYELYQARRRRSDPDHEWQVKRIMGKYAFRLKCLRAMHIGQRSVGRKSREIDCG